MPSVSSRFSSFLAELKRRKVYHVAIAYVVVGAVLGGAANDFLPGLGAPDWTVAFIIVLILIGFPIALILAWAYEVRPEERISQTPSPAPPVDSAVQEPSESLLGTVATAAKSRRPTIAVLPFADFSPDPEDAYFAGGMHEEILTQLQKIGGLAVRARTSVLRYREHPKAVPEIARELGVQYILEGSARKAGDQVRLTAQLMDAEKDEHVWAENYDRALSIENLIAVQADIARQVASELKAAVSSETEESFAKRPTEILEAYEEYLRGKHFAHRYTKSGFIKGAERFQRAVALDQTFAAAHVGLGSCYKELSDLSYIDPVGGYEKARAALRRAVELDDTLGEAYAALASMQFFAEWDMRGPEPAFRRAVEMSPDNADVFLLYGPYLMLLGRSDESIAVFQRAVELEPLLPLATSWLACALFYAKRFEESIETHRRALELDRDWLWSHIYLAHNYSQLGRHTEALAHADKVEAIAEATGDAYLLVYLGGNYACAGKEEKAREILEGATDLHAKGSIDAVTVGVILGQLGETDEAFRWLNRAVDERVGLSLYLKVYGRTFLKDLRSDPRYDDVLRRVGFDA